MLHYALTVLVNVKQITLKFLLTGHTYMPADIIHSTIERFTRKRTVWAPSEWETFGWHALILDHTKSSKCCMNPSRIGAVSAQPYQPNGETNLASVFCGKR